MTNVFHAWFYDYFFRAMRNKIEIEFWRGDSGSKKSKIGYGGVWRILTLMGVWS
jgi:hypothetical protein